MPAPAASGWSGRRAGLAPAGKAPPCHGAHGTQTFLASLAGVRPHNANIYVCALLVPTSGIARPVLSSVEHVLVVHQLGGQTDSDRRRLRRIEIGGAAR